MGMTVSQVIRGMVVPLIHLIHSLIDSFNIHLLGICYVPNLCWVLGIRWWDEESSHKTCSLVGKKDKMVISAR